MTKISKVPPSDVNPVRLKVIMFDAVAHDEQRDCDDCDVAV